MTREEGAEMTWRRPLRAYPWLLSELQMFCALAVFSVLFAGMFGFVGGVLATGTVDQIRGAFVGALYLIGLGLIVFTISAAVIVRSVMTSTTFDEEET